MTKEHLGLALALNVPVFVVVTKIDMCPANILQGQSFGIIFGLSSDFFLTYMYFITLNAVLQTKPQTHSDLVNSPHSFLTETLKLLQRLLKSPGCRKIPVLVQNKDDVIVAASNFSSERY